MKEIWASVRGVKTLVDRVPEYTQLTFVPAGWYHMDAAPRNCTHVDLLMRDGSVVEDAHWASDLSGEEQPPFEGWFVKASESSYRDAGNPIAWRRRATIGHGSEGTRAND